MKKIITMCLSFCMLAVCMAKPVSASEMTYNYTNEDYTIRENDETNQQLLMMLEVNIDEGGETVITPRNRDLVTVRNGVDSARSFVVRRGENIKIHMYITSITGEIKVYACKGSTGAYDGKNLKARWSGTGHHYADLFPNAESGTYNVFVYGVFAGSGAVYAEP